MTDQEAAAPPPNNVLPDLQHPTDILHTINFVSQLLAIVLVSFFMVLRLYVKIFIAPPYYTDDCESYMSLSILSLGYNAAALVDGYFGGGFHIFEISKENFKGYKKLALLWIIIRVFRPHKRTMIGAIVVITFLTGYTIPIVFIKALICRPVAGFWDPAIKATCYNQRAIYAADTAVSAITDMAVLLLPIPVVMNLQMSWNKRFKVIAMLGSGGLAAAASLVRAILVIKLQTSQDESVDIVRFNLLGTAEVSIGLICACLPATHALILRSFGSSSPKIQHNIWSSRIIEMRFLRGNRHSIQGMTTAEVAPVAAFGDIPSVPAQQERRGCIFPFERVSRPSPTSQKAACREVLPDEWDEWYSQVVASPFSEPGAPDWIQKAVDL
ncbi:hypothetical protein CDEST_15348 [Colletotrichum destructivum]|uniref:Rhodopsin domain-containing protein n=1 Tax=Colletotrichum destructivum TaxID=34406 RepID=A0AAX4J4L8_9PEZI|nr:hypothetical protein CDEST_15348 [Colletotrichum destructivum]